MKYVPEEDVRLETSVDQDQFGDVEIALLLTEVKESNVPVLFEITTGGSVFSAPLLHKGVFYCGCCDHNFYALDAGTGQELWRFPTSHIIPLDSVLAGNRVYFGSYDNNFYALSLDGKLAWKFQTRGAVGTAALHNGTIYVGSEDGNLYAIDAKTGRELWRFRTGGPVPGRPAVHKGALYFGSWDHHLYALDLETRRVLWKYRCGNIVGGVTVHRGALYFGSFDHYIYSMTPEGKLLWKYQLPVQMYSVSRPVISGDTIYVGLKDDYMYAISTKGELLWKFRTGHMIATDPAIHNGVVYFGSCDGNFYAADAGTGKLLWKFATTLPIVAPPAISGGRVYFGGGDCNFYCLDLEGRMVWKTPTSLSYPSKVNMENVKREQSANIVWSLPETAEEDEKYRSDEIAITDYGEFSGRYIDITKSHYLGRSKKNYL